MEQTKVMGRINKQELLDKYRGAVFKRLYKLLETQEEINIIYLRVSTQYDQEEKDQLPKNISEFNLDPKKCLLIRSKESAFNLKKDNTRLFTIIKEIVWHEDFKDLKKNLYVWNLNRIYRNREKLVDFGLNVLKNNTLIYSVRQKVLSECLKYEGMVKDLMYYAMLQMYGQSAQEESENKSYDVKKSMKWKDGRPFSRKGKMLGRAFRDLDNKKIRMTTKQKDDMEWNIIKMFEKGMSLNHISRIFAEKKSMKVTRTYLSSQRKKYINGDEAKKNYEELKSRRSARDK